MEVIQLCLIDTLRCEANARKLWLGRDWSKEGGEPVGGVGVKQADRTRQLDVAKSKYQCRRRLVIHLETYEAVRRRGQKWSIFSKYVEAVFIIYFLFLEDSQRKERKKEKGKSNASIPLDWSGIAERVDTGALLMSLYK